MAHAIRRKATVVLTALAAAGTLGIAAPAAAHAAQGTSHTVTSAPAGGSGHAASDVAAKSIDRWVFCMVAPSGSLVIDYKSGGGGMPQSICWSGSGRSVNTDSGRIAEQVHTANNRGSLRMITNGKEWDLPFDRNQTHDLPAGSRILGLSLNE